MRSYNRLQEFSGQATFALCCHTVYLLLHPTFAVTLETIIQRPDYIWHIISAQVWSRAH